MIYNTYSTEETEMLGASLAERLDRKNEPRTFIAMRGEMGVGKTAFVRGFASFFGIRSVKSPTYTVINEYRGRRQIFHLDTYRIESEDDLYSIGFEDYLARDGIIICEWSENIADFIPSGAITVSISRNGESGRIIEITEEL